MKRLDHSIVIATCNRPAALRLSIPRMLKQSRPPTQLIVIDSSDDHAAAVKAVIAASNAGLALASSLVLNGSRIAGVSASSRLNGCTKT